MSSVPLGLPARDAAPAGLRLVAWLALALLLAWLLRLALFAHTGAGLFVDEAQYWWWSRSLQWGYFSKPPAIAVLIAASTTLFGDGLLGVKALAMACYPLAAAVLYALGRDIAGHAVGLWAAAIFMASPLAGLLGLAATTDAPLLLCWALALWALWHAAVRQRGWAWVVLGLVLGGGLLSKYTTAALLPGVLWFAWRRLGVRGLALAAAALALAAAMFAPHLAWNAAWGWPTIGHTVDSTALQAARGRGVLQRLGELLGAQPLLIGPAALWLAWRHRARPRPPGDVAVRDLLLAGTVVLLAAGVAQALRGRVEINWLAPLHLGLALALALHAGPALAQRGAVLRWAAALAAQAAGIAVLALLPAWTAALFPGHSPPAALDLWARMRGWTPALEALTPRVRERRGAVLVAPARDVLAQALYAWRGLGLQPVGFDAEGRVPHHFALACPWSVAAKLPGPFLVLTEGPPPAALQQAFSRVEPLGAASAPRSANRVLHLQLGLAGAPVLPVAAARTPGDCR